jgi:hypothetical protein
MVTAAHEFFHAIHFAYDVGEERFFMELSSTWMEDVVYDAINDYYNYLAPPGYATIFSSPGSSLTTRNGIHEYSSCVWAHYLAKRFGQDIMRDIWERCIQKAALDAMQDALISRGEDLASAHHEFARWNYFTDLRADTVLYYPEGDHYPQVTVYADNLHSTYPVEVGSVSHPPQPLGAGYVSFLPQETPGGLGVEFQGQPEVTWKASLLGIGPPHEVIHIPVDGFGHGKDHLHNWSQYEEVVLVVTPFALSGSGVQYAYEGIPDSSLTEPMQRITVLGQNYPNPVTPQTGYCTVFPFSIAQRSEVSFRIFTLEGQLVAKFDWGYVDPDDYYGPDKDKHYWDCTNASGEPVSAGVYFYQLRAGDFVEMNKAVVVR